MDVKTGGFPKRAPGVGNVVAKASVSMPASMVPACDPVISNHENVVFVASNSVSASKVVNGVPGTNASSLGLANQANSVCVAAVVSNVVIKIASGTPARERAYASPWIRNHAVSAGCANATINVDGASAATPIMIGAIVTSVAGNSVCPMVKAIPMSVHHNLTMPVGNSGSASLMACVRLASDERIENNHTTHHFLHSRV
jgi:hypothetical protein